MLSSARLAWEAWQLRAAVHPGYGADSELVRLSRYRGWAWLGALAVLACVLATYPIEVLGMQLFDAIEEDAEQRRVTVFEQIRDLVRPTFLILATIEVCWAAAIWAFDRDNLNSLAVEVVKKIMTVSFFYLLLEQAPTWIPAIVDSFEYVGTQVAGTRPRITTDGILTAGIQQALSLWASARVFALAMMALPLSFLGTTIGPANALHEFARGTVFVAGIAAIIIVLSHVIVAAQFFCLKMESALLLAVGAIFLGFGSSSWTRDYVSKYLNYAINVGVRMLVLLVILSLTLGRGGGPQGALDLSTVLEPVVVAVLQAILALKAPELAGALLSGGAGLTAGSTSHAAGGMVRSMASGAAAVLNAAKGAGNLVNAAGAGRVGASSVQGGMSAAGTPAGQNTKPSTGSMIPGLGGTVGRSGNHPSGSYGAPSPGSALNTAATDVQQSTRHADASNQSANDRLNGSASNVASSSGYPSDTSNVASSPPPNDRSQSELSGLASSATLNSSRGDLSRLPSSATSNNSSPADASGFGSNATSTGSSASDSGVNASASQTPLTSDPSHEAASLDAISAGPITTEQSEIRSNNDAINANDAGGDASESRSKVPPPLAPPSWSPARSEHSSRVHSNQSAPQADTPTYKGGKGHLRKGSAPLPNEPLPPRSRTDK